MTSHPASLNPHTEHGHHTHTHCMSVMELGYHLSSQDSDYPGVSSRVGPDPVDLGM